MKGREMGQKGRTKGMAQRNERKERRKRKKGMIKRNEGTEERHGKKGRAKGMA